MRTDTLSQPDSLDAAAPDAERASTTAADVSRYLARLAAERPQQAAIVLPETRRRSGTDPGSKGSRDYGIERAGGLGPDDRSGPAAGGPRTVTFTELEQRVQRIADGMPAAGFRAGDRVLLMLRPGVEFVAITYAMFRAGIVPVMIDPGMGVSRMLECIRQVDLRGFVGIPLAHLIRILRPKAFRSVERAVTVGRRWAWGGRTLAEIERLGEASPHTPSPAPATALSGAAAILFTSGSTGPAKGVVYEHSMFDAQVRMIQSQYGIEPGEIDVPTFPLFALFSLAMGMTVVLPRMDVSRPGRVNPARIVEAINGFQATNTFGSPALWRRVAEYCASNRVALPSLRRILIAGAPVPWKTIEQLHAVLGPDADVHTPYGATEALPVSSISGREVILSPEERVNREAAQDRGEGSASSHRGPSVSAAGAAEGSHKRQPMESGPRASLHAPAGRVRPSAPARPTRDLTRRGAGTCVGAPVPGTRVRIIRMADDPIDRWSDDLLLPPGEIGEIVVSGPVVTMEYFGLPRATHAAKIRDGATTWHRMGDAGYLDGIGRLWFCGRKNHRVITPDRTLFTECCEPIFNEHPAVARCALVGAGPAGRRTPVIVVEPRNGRLPRGRAARAFRRELRELARNNDQTTSIDCFLFHRSLPVDVRHNAKINRERLAVWAAGRMRSVE